MNGRQVPCTTPCFRAGTLRPNAVAGASGLHARRRVPFVRAQQRPPRSRRPGATGSRRRPAADVPGRLSFSVVRAPVAVGSGLGGVRAHRRMAGRAFDGRDPRRCRSARRRAPDDGNRRRAAGGVHARIARCDRLVRRRRCDRRLRRVRMGTRCRAPAGGRSAACDCRLCIALRGPGVDLHVARTGGSSSAAMERDAARRERAVRTGRSLRTWTERRAGRRAVRVCRHRPDSHPAARRGGGRPCVSRGSVRRRCPKSCREIAGRHAAPAGGAGDRRVAAPAVSAHRPRCELQRDEPRASGTPVRTRRHVARMRSRLVRRRPRHLPAVGPRRVHDLPRRHLRSQLREDRYVEARRQSEPHARVAGRPRRRRDRVPRRSRL